MILLTEKDKIIDGQRVTQIDAAMSNQRMMPKIEATESERFIKALSVGCVRERFDMCLNSLCTQSRNTRVPLFIF